MVWRQTRAEYERNKGERNRRAFGEIVRSGAEPGILAYDGDQPVGWCGIAPRESYPVLERSRSLQRIDRERVWSVSCFFILKPYRRRGLSALLLSAAAEFARSRGARVLEGYPMAPRKSSLPDPFAWTGLLSTFLQAGFEEAARPSPTRRIMRRVL